MGVQERQCLAIPDYIRVGSGWTAPPGSQSIRLFQPPFYAGRTGTVPSTKYVRGRPARSGDSESLVIRSQHSFRLILKSCIPLKRLLYALLNGMETFSEFSIREKWRRLKLPENLIQTLNRLQHQLSHQARVAQSVERTTLSS